MKIAILSSMSFNQKTVDIKSDLELLGHQVGTPYETSNLKNSKKDHDRLKKELDLIRANFDYVQAHDAVLVINFSKSGIKNYIGGNSLIEMAFAHILKKKIFVLNHLPQMIYTTEIDAMNPTILNGDLRRII